MEKHECTQPQSSSKYYVEYLESERGWGGEIWYTGYNTEAEAHAKVAECNAANTAASAPDYYICASYHGPAEVAPKGRRL